MKLESRRERAERLKKQRRSTLAGMIIAIIVPPHVLIRKGITNVNNAAEVLPMIRRAIGNASMPPITPVPKTSPIYANGSFLSALYKSPPIKAPHMLPGKASNVPRPVRFLISEAAKACARPHHGPTVTAHNMFTRCCTGAHFEPNTGNENILPTTDIATKIAVNVIFLRFDL